MPTADKIPWFKILKLSATIDKQFRMVFLYTVTYDARADQMWEVDISAIILKYWHY